MYVPQQILANRDPNLGSPITLFSELSWFLYRSCTVSQEYYAIRNIIHAIIKTRKSTLRILFLVFHEHVGDVRFQP